jgi:hypothetical protein
MRNITPTFAFVLFMIVYICPKEVLSKSNLVLDCESKIQKAQKFFDNNLKIIEFIEFKMNESAQNFYIDLNKMNCVENQDIISVPVVLKKLQVNLSKNTTNDQVSTQLILKFNDKKIIDYSIFRKME